MQVAAGTVVCIKVDPLIDTNRHGISEVARSNASGDAGLLASMNEDAPIYRVVVHG